MAVYRSLLIFCVGVYSFVICCPLCVAFGLGLFFFFLGRLGTPLGIFGQALDHSGTPEDAMKVVWSA